MTTNNQAHWKLVPVEPTKEMLYELQENCHILPPRGRRVWKQMLTTAPQQPSATSASGERAELIRKAMRRAFSLGQTYWQQADSEYFSQHKKADETRAKFSALVDETVAVLEADVQRPALKPLTDGQIIEIRKSTPTDHSRPWGDTLSFARAIEAAHCIK